MQFNPDKHHRRSIRLKGYDYSQPGWYYVTLCTQNREILFGNMVNGRVGLKEAGCFVDRCWCEIPVHYPAVHLDEYIIMPNHVHGIIGIMNDTIVGVQNFEPLRHENKYQKIIQRSIGSIIRGFKIGITKWFRQNTDIDTVWQRNYYEHIIRNENDLNRIRKYIIENPLTWKEDIYYSSAGTTIKPDKRI